MNDDWSRKVRRRGKLRNGHGAVTKGTVVPAQP